MIGLSVSNVSLAFAPQLARLFSPWLKHQADVDQLACAVAIASFWTADMFINMVQGPCRVLVVDLLPVYQISKGNAYLGVWEGIGKISAFAVGSLPIGRLFP